MLNFRDKLDAMPEQKRYKYYNILSCITATLVAIAGIVSLEYNPPPNTHHAVGAYLFYVVTSMLFALFFTFVAFNYPDDPLHEYTSNARGIMLSMNMFCLISPILGYIFITCPPS